MNHLYFFRLGYYNGNVSAIKKKIFLSSHWPHAELHFSSKTPFLCHNIIGGLMMRIKLCSKLSLGFVFGATFSFEGGYINNMIAVSLLFED